MTIKPPVSIFWYRRDLRLHDNTGLLHAEAGRYPVLPVFIFDKAILENLDNIADPRVTFIHQNVIALKKEIEIHGSTLLIFHGYVDQVFKTLFETFDIKGIYTNRDYEPYAIERDNRIADMAHTAGAGFYTFKDQVVFEGSEILTQSGTPFKVFTPFRRAWLSMYSSVDLTTEFRLPDFRNFLRASPAPEVSLQSIGFEHSSLIIPSSEPDIKTIQLYDKNRNFPAINGTTRIGIHLRFGTVSIRELARMAFHENETWLNELIWREFFSAILQHFPFVAKGAFNKKFDHIPWRNDESEYAHWCQGRTGYPIVDAGMRELNATGFMHNRVRMIVASFLTKHLLIDWRWGEAYFASRLLDYELASNNGGWQWAAGTGTDAQPWFRIFNPQSQAEKFDPKEVYIKKWLPEYGTPSYPLPIVDHKLARARALDTYKRAVS